VVMAQTDNLESAVAQIPLRGRDGLQIA
jgi:hypothetical protein